MAGRNEAKIKFTADTSAFTQQIKEVNSNMSALRAGLSLNEAAFKNTGDKAEYLKNKQNLLKDQLKQNADKQEALNNKLEAAKKIYGENSTEAQQWATKLTKAETEQQNLERQLQETNDAIEEQAKEEKKAQTPLEQLNKKIEEQENELKDLKTQYANVAIAQGKDSKEAKELQDKINALNNELEQNEQQLKDVTSATDKAADANEGANEGWTKGGQILANFGTKILGDVIGKLKEAAAAVINLGMEFTKSMSNVQALSGASSTEMGKLEASAKELGRNTIFSASQVSDAFGYMALAGWDTQEMLSGINGVLSLAATSGMELADASDMVTDYLSAFGLEAQDAAGMVDMLAYAQAHSNTTAEQLGDAFGNSASMMHTAGQTMETTTAILESFANQGMKGSEAGTALSAMMRDITQKMKGGKIMIGDTAIEVQDANGNFRNMIDILADVESATDGMGSAEKSAALMTTFTARSVKGVSMALNEGSDALSDYEDQLYNCTGSAEEMSEVMQDNLSGDMAAMQSAMEGLGLQLFSFFEGPLREGAQFATDAINAITDALTPNETVLSRFIKETNESINANRAAIEAASSMVDDALGNVAEIDFYKGVIMDLNEKTALTELEQYQLKDAVNQLSATVPGLADNWDEATGTLKLSNEELEKLFDNAQKLALQSAMLEIQTETTKALARAKVDEARAQQGAQKALDEYNSTSERTYNGINELNKAIGNNAWSDEEAAVMGAAHAYEEAKKATEEAQQAAEELPDALRTAAIEMGASEEEADLMAKGLYGVGDAATESSQEIAEASAKSEEELQAEQEAAQKLEEEFYALRDSIQQSVHDSITYLDEFTHAEETSATAMANNLTASNEYITDWIANMDTLGQAMEGMSGKEKEAFQQLYDDMLQKGPQTAGEAAKAMAAALSDPNNKGEFDRVVDEYSRSLDLTSDSAKLAQYSSTGKAFTGEMAKGITGSASEVTSAAGQVASDATDQINTEVDSGMDVVNNTWDGQMDSMQSTADSAMNNIRSSVNGMITDITKALGKEIKGPNIKVPHFTMTGDFDAKTKKVPTVTVDWYARGAIFTQPTIFGTPYGFKGVGEHGAEAVLPVELLKEYVTEAVSASSNNVFNIEMTVDGAENPTAWAADFARTLKQQMRIS